MSDRGKERIQHPPLINDRLRVCVCVCVKNSKDYLQLTSRGHNDAKAVGEQSRRGRHLFF